MNLQHQQIYALCEQMKLPALQTEWPALAQRVADTQGSFADFLLRPSRASEPPGRSASARRC